MAGHSHWAQVKHKKSHLDFKRSQLFSKLIRAIIIAAREGNDPEINPKLKSAIERAKKFQVPAENIERALKKVKLGEENLEEVIYEAYLDDIQVLIKAITDNKNKTLGEIKHILNEFGGKLAESGAVSWNFSEKLIVTIDRNDLEKIFDLIGLFDDFEEKGNDIVLVTSVKNFNSFKNTFENKGIKIKDYSFELKPVNKLKISDPLKLEKLRKFIDKLSELDDVNGVFTNA